MILLKCLPFLFFAGLGTYILCACFFPSWREPSWRHWKVYSGTDDPNPNAWSHALGFTKPPKPVVEGDWPEQTTRRVYFFAGVIMFCIAFLGIRHFAGIPSVAPDIFESLPK
jgi:hypothetical protein